MKRFRNPKYIKRYEDVVFDLPNNGHQKKDQYRFVVDQYRFVFDQYRFVADNSGEVTPFDWYNARISVDFKVNKLVDGANVAANDHNGIVNGSHSLIRNFDIKLNGKKGI